MVVVGLIGNSFLFPPLAASDWSMRLAVGVLIGVLLLGAVVIAATKKWQKAGDSLTPDANEQLAQFRTLYEEGELSEEEFRKIKQQLTGQLRQDWKLDTGSPPEEAEQQADPDPEPKPDSEADDRIQPG